MTSQQDTAIGRVRSSVSFESNDLDCFAPVRVITIAHRKLTVKVKGHGQNHGLVMVGKNGNAVSLNLDHRSRAACLLDAASWQSCG